MVEQLTFNQWVTGSIPVGRTTYYRNMIDDLPFIEPKQDGSTLPSLFDSYFVLDQPCTDTHETTSQPDDDDIEQTLPENSLLIKIEKDLEIVRERYFKDIKLSYKIHLEKIPKSDRNISGIRIKFDFVESYIENLKKLLEVVNNHNLISIIYNEGNKLAVEVSFVCIDHERNIYKTSRMKLNDISYVNKLTEKQNAKLYFKLRDFLVSSNDYPIRNKIDYVLGTSIIKLTIKMDNLKKIYLNAMERLLNKLSSYADLIISIKLTKKLHESIGEDIIIFSVFLKEFKEDSAKSMLSDILCIPDLDLQKFQNSKAIMREKNDLKNGLRLGFRDIEDLLAQFYGAKRNQKEFKSEQESKRPKTPRTV